jgi:regulator of replication initiation timing
MGTDRATGIESTGPTVDALDEQLQQLQRRVDALENENDRLHSELEKTRKQQQEDRHTLARENHELRKANDQLRERVDRAEDSRGHIIEDIVDVEEQLADVEPGSPGSKGGGDTPETTIQRPDLIPIERISKMDAEDTGIDMTPSIERAVAIFDHWEEWSDKTPKGRVLKNDLKTLLRTATGERLAWRQAYRAAEALEELSKGRIEFIDHSRHGKMLIEAHPARSGDCHSSSAATT